MVVLIASVNAASKRGSNTGVERLIVKKVTGKLIIRTIGADVGWWLGLMNGCAEGIWKGCVEGSISG